MKDLPRQWANEARPDLLIRSTADYQKERMKINFHDKALNLSDLICLINSGRQHVVKFKRAWRVG